MISAIRIAKEIIETNEVAFSQVEWKKANLTNFISYPDPNSEEWTKYNGGKWQGVEWICLL